MRLRQSIRGPYLRGPSRLLPCRVVNPGDHTIDTIKSEIQRIVSERQDLRGTGAGAEVLEENRRLLAHAQSLFSHLLIQHHLPALLRQ